jgi:hypothetical protein
MEQCLLHVENVPGVRRIQKSYRTKQGPELFFFCYLLWREEKSIWQSIATYSTVLFVLLITTNISCIT